MKCRKCHIDKNEEVFDVLNPRDGRRSTSCRDCETERKRLWTLSNPEKAKVSRQKWEKNNQQKSYAMRKEWCRTHREQRRATMRKHRDKVKNTIEYKLNSRMSTSINRALKYNNLSENKVKLPGCKWERIVGYNVKELKFHIESQFSEGMNWDEFVKGNIHIDHIVPRVCFDLCNLDEVKKCWSLINLRPLWKDDNELKSDIILGTSYRQSIRRKFFESIMVQFPELAKHYSSLNSMSALPI